MFSVTPVFDKAKHPPWQSSVVWDLFFLYCLWMERCSSSCHIPAVRPVCADLISVLIVPGLVSFLAVRSEKHVCEFKRILSVAWTQTAAQDVGKKQARSDFFILLFFLNQELFYQQAREKQGRINTMHDGCRYETCVDAGASASPVSRFDASFFSVKVQQVVVAG